MTRQAVEGQGGHIFKTVGDLHCVVFERAEAALAAAMSAQRAVAAGPWDPSPPPRIRIALHSGAPIARGGNLLGLGRVAARTEPDRAPTLFEEALAVLQEADSLEGVALVQLALAWVTFAQGDPAGAAALLAPAIDFFAAGDDPIPALDCFTCLAAVAVARDDAERATRLLGAVAALRGEVPVVPTPRERREMDEALTAARSALSRAGFDAAFGEGQSLSLIDAITLAREIAGIPASDR